MSPHRDTSSPHSLEEIEDDIFNKPYVSLDVQDVLDNFPFPKFRPYQKEKIIEIVEAFNSGYRWILLEAPTGFGKSPVNVAFCRTLRSFYTTPQNILLDQLQDDFPDLALIKGRKHYDCVEQYPFKCDDGPCQRDHEYQCYDKYARCLYWKAKISAINAQTALTNFAYFIGEGRIRNPNIPHLGNRELLVIDEGHNIDEHILGHISITINRRTLPDPVYYDIRDTLSKLPEKLTGEHNDTLLDKTSRLCLDYLNELPSRLNEEMIINAKKAEGLIQKVEDYWKNHDADWLGQTRKKVYRRGTWVEVKIQPTFVHGFMKKHLWNRANRFIVSSATIFANSFIKECGLTSHSDEVYHIVTPSTFPIQNRRIIDASIGSLSWSNRTKNMPAVVDTIRRILEHEKGKGVIHAHSYAFAEAIKDGIPDPRLLFHESINRDKSLQEFLDSPPESGRILVAVAMTEGLDLHGDLATFQILLKCPYANYVADRRVGRRLKELKHNRWYAVQTLKIIVQAYGRAVRSPTDQAAFYILDSDVNRICKRWRRQLPQFFAEAYNKRERFT